MRWRRATALLWCLASITHVAIGCSRSPLDVAAAADAGNDFPHAMASAFCAALERCCTSSSYGFAAEACLSQVESQYDAEYASRLRPHVVFDPKAASACVAALGAREALCTADSGASPGIDAGFVSDVDRACFGVVNGTLSPGDRCDDGSQCKVPDAAHYAFCEEDIDPQSPTFGQQFCALSNPHALPGEACDLIGRSPSSAHVTYFSCESSLGTCQSRTSANDAEGVCVAWATDGQPCGFVDGMPPPVTCTPGTSYCDTNMASTGVCRPLPGIGEPCVAASASCARGAFCDAGTCSAPRAEGESCTNYDQCASQVCATHFPAPDSGTTPGRCAPPYPSFALFEVSPRVCGFGPTSSGPDDAGITSD